MSFFHLNFEFTEHMVCLYSSSSPLRPQRCVIILCWLFGAHIWRLAYPRSWNCLKELKQMDSTFPDEARGESPMIFEASSLRLQAGVIRPLFIFFGACYGPGRWSVLIWRWQVTSTSWGFIELCGTLLPPKSLCIMTLILNLIYLSSGSFQVQRDESSALVLFSH